MITACILVLGANARAKTGISVEPEKIEVSVRRNGLVPKALIVKNTGDEVLSVSIILKEIAQNLSGVFIYPDVRFPRSVVPYISLSSSSFEVWPGQSADVDMDVNLPENMKTGSLYAALVVRYKTVQQGSRPVDTVVPIMITPVASQVVKGEISEVSLKQALKGDLITIQTVFKNSGTTHFSASGMVRIKDEFDKEITLIPINTGLVLPGYSVQVRTFLKPDMLQPGTYVAESTLKAGSFSDAKKKTFRILQPLEMAQPRASIADIRVQVAERFKPLNFQFTVINDGNMDLFAERGEITVLDVNNVPATQTSFKGGMIQVKTSKKFSGSFPKGIPAGNYVLLATVDYGMEEPAVGELKFNVLEFTPVIKGSIKDFSVNVGTSAFVPSFESRFTFKNDSNMPVVLDGTIEVRDPAGAVVDKIKISRSTVDTGTSKVLVSKWDSNLPRGIYSAALEVSYYEKTSATAATQIVVDP